MSENSLTAQFGDVRKSWGWLLALGIAFIILGAVCIVYDVMATFTTVFFFGCLLAISGVLQLIQSFRTGTWSGFFVHLLGALLRGFTGYLLIRYPLMGAEALTLLLASFFIVGGVFRAIGSGMVKFPRWGWAVFSGVVAIALGVVLLFQMPTSGLWFIGFALGVDLVFDGGAIIGLSSAIHHLPALPALRTA